MHSYIHINTRIQYVFCIYYTTQHTAQHSNGAHGCEVTVDDSGKKGYAIVNVHVIYTEQSAYARVRAKS